ncbi:MAG: circadian clock protein KaiB [Calditrichia bacterium]
MKKKSVKLPEHHESGSPFYRLWLFVAGDDPNSATAKAVVFRLCREHLRDRCDCRIIDVYENYQAAIDHGIILIPTLMVETPPPIRRMVGSLNDEQKLLEVLGLYL